MSLISIDEDLCTSCGGCVDECPGRIISHGQDGSHPVSVEEREPLCINCWHCVAVCPVDALEHSMMKPDSCPEFRKELAVSMEQARQFLRSRRSIRKYRDTAVEKEKIKNLIEMARYAPSGHNSQNVKWLVIQSREKLNILEDMVIDWMRYMLKEMPEAAQAWNMDRIVTAHEEGIRTICRGAPHVIIAYGSAGDLTAQTNSFIAMSYLELAAVSMGLGSCWAGFFNAASQYWPPLQKALELPEDQKVFSSMMLGYPLYRYNRLAPRNEPDISFS